MNQPTERPNAILLNPPRIVPSLVNGFNTITTHIYLLFLPVMLDLLLWFGPHIRIRNLMLPALSDLFGLMRKTNNAEMQPMLDSLEKVWRTFLEQYNLLINLSTFPVGIPALLAGELPMKTPLGVPQIVEVSSFGQFFLSALLLVILGMGLGSIYFAITARACVQQMNLSLPKTDPASSTEQSSDAALPILKRVIMPQHSLPWITFQVIALTVVLLLFVLMIVVPAIALTTLVALISPFLGQVVLMLASFAAIWLLMPLVFSPHGIFFSGQNVLNTVLASNRVVRFSLPTTGSFVLAVIVLSQGLNLLWSAPPANSWMTLVGIIGHAFILSGLLAASFFYYRAGIDYVQGIRELTFPANPATGQ